jgi:hypothetical protein
MREQRAGVNVMSTSHAKASMQVASTPNSTWCLRPLPINSRIQWVKRMACGYRNRENFRHAIYFHLGGLDLYPEALKSAHSKA